MPAKLRNVSTRRRIPAKRPYKRKGTFTVKPKVSTAVRQYVKKSISTSKELKYTLFQQVVSSARNVSRSDYILQTRFMHTPAIYPAVGDTDHNIDGSQYQLYGFNVMITVRQLTGNQNYTPLDIYVVRQSPNKDLSDNSTVGVSTLYPQSGTSDIVTWTNGVPAIFGRLDNTIGRVIMKKRILPKAIPNPSGGIWSPASASGTSAVVNTDNYDTIIKMFVPCPHRIHKTVDTAEFPNAIPKFALLFHSPSYFKDSSNGWQITYVYTQATFKDI